MNAKAYFKLIDAQFKSDENIVQQKAMVAYMKNHFLFHGIKSPERKTILRNIASKHGHIDLCELKPLFELLWNAPQREYQYAAFDIATRFIKKMDDTFLPFFEEYITQKSWWDSVDWLAPTALGRLFLRFPENRHAKAESWINSDNIWLQRSAILHQLKHHENTDVNLLFELVLKRKDSKEFFVQKAAGWALRQHSKFEANRIVKFVKSNKLAPLTEREALKWLKGKNLL